MTGLEAVFAAALSAAAARYAGPDGRLRVRAGAGVGPAGAEAPLRPLHRRRLAAVEGRRPRCRRSTRPPRRRWPRWPRRTRPTSTPRVRPRARPTEVLVEAAAAPSAASTSSASRALMQEKARELAVVETMDGGKPIKESRDVDIPLVAAHFFYHAGWADKLEYALPGRDVRPLGVARPDHPVELPAADGGVEDRAGAGVRQHRRAQARGDDAADGAAAGGDHRGGRAAAGRGEHHHRRRRDGRRAGRPPRRRQGRLHRVDRGRQADPARARRHATKRLTLELGGKAANIVFADAPIDQAVEGIVNGIYFNQGHVCCAGSRLLVEESVHDIVVAQARRPHGDAARSAIRWTRTPTSAPSTRRCSSSGSASSSRPARQEGASATQPPCELPERGFWFAPTFFTGVAPVAPDRARGDLRAGAHGDDVPRRRTKRSSRRTTRVRPVRRHLDGQGREDLRDGAAS